MSLFFALETIFDAISADNGNDLPVHPKIVFCEDFDVHHDSWSRFAGRTAEIC